MKEFIGNIGVFFGQKELQPASRASTAYPGNSLANVEAFEETFVNDQVHGYINGPHQGTQKPTADDLFQLPAGGMHDKLLEMGSAAELLAQLPEIFRKDPPVKCGSNRNLLGLSCVYGGQYSHKVFSPAAVARHLQLASTFWNPEPKDNVQKLVIPKGSRLLIVGDVHGQLEDVLWIFFKYGAPSATNQYLFNGDLVDRGGHALEIMLLLLSIKREVPSAVHIQRGNHEDVQTCLHFGFRAELESKFKSHFGPVWNLCCNAVFPLLPLVTVVLGPLTGDRSFCVLHGGVPVDCPGQTGPASLGSDFDAVDRLQPSVHAPKTLGDHFLFNLLWADPTDSAADKRKRSRMGRGNHFIESDTCDFCKANGLAFVVRSHEVPRSLRGAAATHGGKVYTLFSASNYMGTVGNRGGVFICDVGQGLQLREHWAPPWQELAGLFRRYFAGGSSARLQAVASWEEAFQIAMHPEDAPTQSSPSECISPRKPVPPPSGQYAEGADDQLGHFLMERICENKDLLFTEFRTLDSEMTGLLPKATWHEVIMTHLGPTCDHQVVTHALLDRLAKRWGIADPVGYVRFLHRFQIRGDAGGSLSSSGDYQPDLLREVSAVRRKLADTPFRHLEQLLDPDEDRTVTQTELLSFLRQIGVDVTPLQAGVLYEIMSNFMEQNPLTVDSTVLCLAIMSRDPAPQNRWSEMSEMIGQDIFNARKSFAHVFRSWDTDRDGFLSLEELAQGLKQLPALPSLPDQDVSPIMKHIESMGMANNRISIFEFVRAIAPRDLTMQLHQAMLKDILKRVWIFRPALHALLAKGDPRGTNRVTVSEFHSCMVEINHQLERRGWAKLSPTQLEAICEIAAHGHRWVDYEEFIRGLHVVDIVAAQ